MLLYCSNPFGGKSFESFRSSAEVNKHSRDSPIRSVVNGAIHIHCHLQVGLAYIGYRFTVYLDMPLTS